MPSNCLRIHVSRTQLHAPVNALCVSLVHMHGSTHVSVCGLNTYVVCAHEHVLSYMLACRGDGAQAEFQAQRPLYARGRRRVLCDDSQPKDLEAPQGEGKLEAVLFPPFYFPCPKGWVLMMLAVCLCWPNLPSQRLISSRH